MIFLDYLMPFLAGVMGAMGLGSGTVLLLYLTLIKGMDQLSAQGINLLFFIPVSIVSLSVYIFKKRIKIRPLLPLIFWGLPFCFLGFITASMLGNAYSAKLFGILLIFIGIKELFISKRE